MFDYSADNIVQSIRDMAYSGVSNRDWDDARVLRLLNRMMVEYMVPFIEEHRKDYFVTYVDVPLVASQVNYRIPSKAAGGRVRFALLVDSSGNPYQRLREMELESAAAEGAASIAGPFPRGIPQGYYFGGGGNSLVMWPTPNGSPAGLSIRIFYVARPSSLVYQASCLHVTSLLPGAPPQGPAAPPAGFFRVGVDANGLGAAPVWTDLVQNSPGFDVLFSGQTYGALQGYYVELAGTLPADLNVGDWVCAQDTAPVVTGGIAECVIGCLVARTAEHIAIAQRDKDAAAMLGAARAESEKSAVRVLSMRRSTGDRRKVGGGSLNRNRRGLNWWGV
ncbi:MAG: phage adaptor protein [Dehalococcoidia bacterium]